MLERKGNCEITPLKQNFLFLCTIDIQDGMKKPIQIVLLKVLTRTRWAKLCHMKHFEKLAVKKTVVFRCKTCTTQFAWWT